MSDPDLLLFGPQDITIRHEPDDGYLEEFRAALVGEDVVVEATFHNPASAGDPDWSYGFIFRARFTNYYYLATINSESELLLYTRAEDPEQRGELVQQSADINTAAGEKNVFRIVTIGERGWIYINGQLQGEMDLSVIGAGGGIRAIVDDKKSGETQVDGLTVWEWGESLATQMPEVDAPPANEPVDGEDPEVPVFGPTVGSLTHDPDDEMPEVHAAVLQGGDVMIAVTFKNPYAPNESHWNYGISLENSDGFHWVSINSKRTWLHNYYSFVREDHGWLPGEREAGIDVSEGGENHLRIIVKGDTGWFYVNDRFIGNVNLSLGGMPHSDFIGLVVNDNNGFGNRYKAGDTTKFEYFTVWKWHPSLFELPDDD